MSLLPQSKEQHGIELFIFWKQFNYIMIRASDVHFITIAAVPDHGALLIQNCISSHDDWCHLFDLGKRFVARNLN